MLSWTLLMLSPLSLSCGVPRAVCILQDHQRGLTNYLQDHLLSLAVCCERVALALLSYLSVRRGFVTQAI